MSILSSALFIVFMTLVVSQFGTRLSARQSTLWWLIFAFLLSLAVAPQTLEPLARILGIQVVSNLFFAIMIFFLLWQQIEQNASNFKTHRSLMMVVSKTASEQFVLKSKPTAPVLVVLPCYNEEASLKTLVQSLRAEQEKTKSFDLMFVDDGSKDSTAEVLNHFAVHQCTSHYANIGVSGVLCTGFYTALKLGYTAVVQFDADGQHPVSELSHFIERGAQMQADLLIGSRYVGPNENRKSTTQLRRWGGYWIYMLLKIFPGTQFVRDPTSGMRLYSRKAMSILLNQMPDEYPEPESIAILGLEGANILETHVPMSKRATGKSSLAGLRGPLFVVKVTSALIGLRLRHFFNQKSA